VLVVGPNGAGKTNLLEAIHLGSQGFSPRTRSDAELIRFGSTAGKIALAGRRDGAPVRAEVTLRLREGKRATLDGAPLRAAEQLRSELPVLVFTPDRLAVVKGGPIVRRAYFDRVLGRLWPSRATLPGDYWSVVSQRNAALRRIAAGLSSPEALVPWTERVVELGGQLVAARRQLAGELQTGFAVTAAELGLAGGRLRYEGTRPTAAALTERLSRDLDRGTTGLGPHLDDFGVWADERELRSFGSQGEQRLAVLALLLAEAELLRTGRGVRPLLLLDDVLSELDAGRREALARRIRGSGQAFVSATSAAALPASPDELVEVAPGTARRVT
jgi:DNA replication and repair protein RecF